MASVKKFYGKKRGKLVNRFTLNYDPTVSEDDLDASDSDMEEKDVLQAHKSQRNSQNNYEIFFQRDPVEVEIVAREISITVKSDADLQVIVDVVVPEEQKAERKKEILTRSKERIDAEEKEAVPKTNSPAESETEKEAWKDKEEAEEDEDDEHESVDDLMDAKSYEDSYDGSASDDSEPPPPISVKKLKWCRKGMKNVKTIDITYQAVDENVDESEIMQIRPIDYFKHFIDDDILQKICDESNVYVLQCNVNKPLKLIKGELEQFIGILFVEYLQNAFSKNVLAVGNEVWKSC